MYALFEQFARHRWLVQDTVTLWDRPIGGVVSAGLASAGGILSTVASTYPPSPLQKGLVIGGGVTAGVGGFVSYIWPKSAGTKTIKEDPYLKEGQLSFTGKTALKSLNTINLWGLIDRTKVHCGPCSAREKQAHFPLPDGFSPDTMPYMYEEGSGNLIGDKIGE
jgi:hypothetical protein